MATISRGATVPQRSAWPRPSIPVALGEFVLVYETVRAAPDPQAALVEFLPSSHEAAANGGDWERARLERRTNGEPEHG